MEAGGKTAKNLQAIQLAFENSLAYSPTAPFRALFRPVARFLRAPIGMVKTRLQKLAHHYQATTRYNPPPPQVHRKKRLRFYPSSSLPVLSSLTLHNRLGDIFILCCVIYAISWNASNLGSSMHLPYNSNWVGLVLHLDQVSPPPPSLSPPSLPLSSLSLSL